VLGKATATPRDSAHTAWLVIVPMVAWQPGIADSAAARLRVTGPDGATVAVPVVLPLPQVRSVLPADSTKWRVRPPHDVWGPSYDWPRVALLAALAILLIALLAWAIVTWVRRRRAARIPATARERALALLERARTSGFIEAGNWKAFYTLVSDALRGLAADLDPRWSTDLTSPELVERIREGGADDDHVETLERLLRVADLAKFARRGRAPDDARRDLEDARRWVETFALPSPETAEEPEMAGAGAEAGP
ncbi:MAG: hypothetical protein JO306_09960, partial [Gemmatimonadetes bacterium]|nr:hypothetical protein [Gemmatimonadota bacterium]